MSPNARRFSTFAQCARRNLMAKYRPIIIGRSGSWADCDRYIFVNTRVKTDYDYNFIACMCWLIFYFWIYPDCLCLNDNFVCEIDASYYWIIMACRRHRRGGATPPTEIIMPNAVLELCHEKHTVWLAVAWRICDNHVVDSNMGGEG